MAAPDLRGLRFFADETSLGIGKALAIVRTDVIHTGHKLIAGSVPLGAKDPDWMARGVCAGLDDDPGRPGPCARF